MSLLIIVEDGSNGFVQQLPGEANSGCEAEYPDESAKDHGCDRECLRLNFDELDLVEAR